MRFLTDNGLLLCEHKMGVVSIVAGQDLVHIYNEGWRKVLIKADPVGRPIGGCAYGGGAFLPCTSTVNVIKGYSEFISIDGRPVCLDTIEGVTTGTPQNTILYNVVSPGQNLVEELK